MATEVNAAVLAANRKPISIIGSTLGTQYFLAQARTCDVDFEKKKLFVTQNGDIDLILNRVPRRYRMTGHDIISVSYGQDVVGSPKVIINKDEECEVSLPVSVDLNAVGAVTDDALKKALSGDKNIIFSNAAKLCNQLEQLNNDEITRVDAVMETLKRYRQAIVQANVENRKKAEQYEREMVESTPKNFSAEVTVLNPQNSVKVNVIDD